MVTELKEIKIGDIVLLKSVEEYEEDGDEITELVEKFAGHTMEVLHVGKDLNEFGEKTYQLVALNMEVGFITATDHEIAKVYREI